MEHKLKAQISILEMRFNIYTDLAEAKRIERDEHSVTSLMYGILDTSYSRLEAQAETIAEIKKELEEILAEAKQEA
ncbi:hypothetical protein P59_261 [Bacillus phage P59]|nr:hypothetical protein P59_032 [Bacillus phage P59]QIW88858.1 hypothetical protein P59_261 [Bacillus phage P59]